MLHNEKFGLNYDLQLPTSVDSKIKRRFERPSELSTSLRTQLTLRNMLAFKGADVTFYKGKYFLFK